MMSRGRHIESKARTGRSKWLVLGLVLGLFLAMAIPVGAGTPTTEIFKIGDFEPSATAAIGMDEFSQTGWANRATENPSTFDAGDYPAAIIDPGRVGDFSIHDARGVATLNINFELDYDFIDLTLSLAKYGVESDSVVVVDTAYSFTAPGAGEGIWNRVDLEIPFLAKGSHTITITLAGSPEPEGNGAHVWDALMLTGDQVPTGEITSPYDGEILFVGDTLELGAIYNDDDPSGVAWAVRKDSGTCTTGIVAGNVNSFSTPSNWDGATFSSSIDTSSWVGGEYCFVFNPVETGNETNMRLVQQFRIADGYINGGGQIIQDDPNSKKPFKVSFGGELWRFGSTVDVECDWTVQFHKVSISQASRGTFEGSSCSLPGVFPDGGADGVTNFAVYGTFNGEPGYTVVIRMEDFTEPGKQDTIRFELLYDPFMTATPDNSLGLAAVYDTSDKAPVNHPGAEFTSGSNNSGSARTLLDRGNLQIDLR